MADSRVYPGTSDDVDIGYSTVGYRGAAASSLSNDEMESQRNRMTLHEARWIGVRKKVPGMSGIPKKPRRHSRSQAGSTFYVDTEDPYLKVSVINVKILFFSVQGLVHVAGSITYTIIVSKYYDFVYYHTHNTLYMLYCFCPVYVLL